MKKLIDNADSSNLWPRIKKCFLFCLLDLSRPTVINCFATCGDKLVQRLVLGDSLHASIALYLVPPVNHQDKRKENLESLQLKIERKKLFCIVFSSTRCNVDSRVCVGLANLCRFAPSTDFGSPQFWQNSKVAITSLPREWSCHERKLCSNDHITCLSLSIKSQHLMDRSVRVGSVLKDI